MPFINWKTLIDADNAGRTFFSTWRKTPTQVTGAGIWFDLSMSPGTGANNGGTYTVNISQTVTSQAITGTATPNGIQHGGDVGANNKSLSIFAIYAGANIPVNGSFFGHIDTVWG